MALIKCPECGKEISSEAVFCPNCGKPMNQSCNEVQKKTGDAPSEKHNATFPSLPLIMNVGKQIPNWKFDTTIQDGYYLTEVNACNYFKEGKINVMAHTNGICLKQGLNFFYIHHAQIEEIKSITYESLVEKGKSVVGRAIVGGVLLGPLGAVVGGMSGIGNKVKKVGSYYLVITFWDVFSHSIQTLLIATETRCTLFINRFEEEIAKKNTPEGGNVVCNVLNDSGSLDDSKILEAVKSVGKMNVSSSIAFTNGQDRMSALAYIDKIAKSNNIDSSQLPVGNSGCIVTLIALCGSFMGLVSLMFVILV